MKRRSFTASFARLLRGLRIAFSNTFYFKQLAGGRTALAFCVDVAASMALVDRFIAAGIPAPPYGRERTPRGAGRRLSRPWRQGKSGSCELRNFYRRFRSSFNRRYYSHAPDAQSFPLFANGRPIDAAGRKHCPHSRPCRLFTSMACPISSTNGSLMARHPRAPARIRTRRYAVARLAAASM